MTEIKQFCAWRAMAQQRDYSDEPGIFDANDRVAEVVASTAWVREQFAKRGCAPNTARGIAMLCQLVLCEAKSLGWCTDG